MKKLFCLFLVLAMLASLLPAALAEEIVIVDPEAEDEIDLVELAEPEGDPFPLDDPAEPLEEERAPAESIFAEGRGAAETWRVNESNAESGKCGDDLTWKLDGGKLTISGSGAMWDFTTYAPGWYASCSSIKSLVIEEGVLSVGLNAFINCEKLASVTLPQSLVLISNWSFSFCTSLTSITIPKSVQAIGSGAFAYDSALTAINAESGSRYFKSVDGVLFSPSGQVLHSFPAGKSGEYTVAADVLAIYDEAFEGCGKLTAVKGGDGLLALGVAAFYGCGKLNSVSLGTQLQAIGAGAFYLCAALRAVALPDGLQEIGQYAFYQSGLTSVVIPDSVTELGESCFEGCQKLASVTLGGGISAIEKNTFAECAVLKSLAIPEGVTKLGENALLNCAALTKLTLPSTLKTFVCPFAVSPYKGCPGLKTAGPVGGGYNIEFAWTDEIPAYAFYWCDSLVKIHTGNKIKQVGDNAACHNEALTEAILGKKVESVGSNAFDTCQNLTRLEFRGDTKKLGDSAFSLCSSLQSVDLPASLTEFGVSVFDKCFALQSITIPEGTKVLSKGMLEDCDALSTVTLPESLETIGASALAYCDSLQTLEIPANVTEIGEYAFRHSNLKKLTIPASVTTIGKGAFNSYGLQSAGPIGSGCDIEFGWTEEIPDQAFAESEYLLFLDTGDSVKRIGKQAFQWCKALEEVRLGDSVKSVGERAFASCSSLAKVTFHSEVESIGASAFGSCAFTSIEIPDSVTEIGTGAFGSCSKLKSIRLPAGLTAIRDYTFSGCTSLDSVEIPEGVTGIGSRAFYACQSIKKMQLPEGLTELGENAFCDCRSLREINIPAGITVLHAGLFTNCISLTSFVIPDTVTTLENYVFNQCSALESVTIPDSVTEMGAGMFSQCSALKTVHIPEGVTAFGAYMFNGCSSLESVNVPDSVTTIDYYAFSGCSQLTELRLGKGVAKIADAAFGYGAGIRSLIFTGSAPELTWSSFTQLTSTAVYYPAGDESWDAVVGQNYGGKKITWVAYLNQPGPTPVAGLSTAGVSLAWDALEGAESCELQRSADGGAWKTLATATDGAYTDAAVQMGVTYRYRLRASIGGAVTDWGDPVEVFFNPFADVSGKKTIEYVSWAYNNDIVKGTGATSFSPDEPCTRIQFVMMLWKMHGSPVVEGANPFSDISGKKTTNAILWALDKGVINASSRFDPDGNISRVQIVMILWKLAGSPTVEGENPFSDVSGSKTTKAVLWAYQNGITKGTSDTTFAPDKDCTRVQLVVFLYKYVETHPYLR